MEFEVNGKTIKCTKKELMTSGSVGIDKAYFTFSSDWAGLTKTATFYPQGKKNLAVDVVLINDECDIPPSVLVENRTLVVGVTGNQGTTIVMPTVECDSVSIARGIAMANTTEIPPTPSVYQQFVTAIHDDYLAVEADKTAVATDKATVAMDRSAAETAAQSAQENALSAQTSATNAAISENHADSSEAAAQTAKVQAQQALTDLLAMLGTDIATLVGGKIPMSQIPATATQEIYTVTDENQLTSLTAQRGDLAELIETVGTEETVTKTWQCLGDSTVRSNWVVWGTSYAVQAGNATTADTAVNATMINNHRLVEMSAADYETAVKDPDTYYLVG